VSRRTTPCRLLTAAAVILVGGAILWWAGAPPIRELKRDGNRMVEAFERFRSANGHYPDSLGEVGVMPPTTRYGRWRYQLDGGDFTLAVGEYKRDGFVLHYSTYLGRGQWHINN
jgi:hypothetical protein